MKLLRALGFAAVGLLGLMTWGSAAHAQDSVTRANIGDVLHVEVEGRADISGDFTVDKGGSIALPSVGRVAVAGRTTFEIGTDIARRMSLISSKITQVTVTLAQVASRRNFVLGAVLLPGMYVFRELPTVWDAITEAGGPTDDADLTSVEILSDTQPKPIIVDVTTGATGGLSTLPRLHPGDTVRVPRLATAIGGSKDLIFVFGAVGFQGPQPLSLAPDLVSAFIRCNPSADVDFKNVEIVRRNGPQIVRLRVSMGEYFERGDIVGNPALQPGDTIHFKRTQGPFSPLRVVGGLASILGLVTSIVVLTR
jgi:protein involved in polysaccharide export with SLBB domain